MSLTNAYLITTKNVEAFFNAIVSAKAPERLNYKFLRQLEFSSSNDRLFIGVLRWLGFIDESGVPEQRYYDYLDQSQSGVVLAEAIKEAYDDLFAVHKKAYTLSVDEVRNKLKTLTQGKKSDNVIKHMANTFKALCALADWSKTRTPKDISPPTPQPKQGLTKDEKTEGPPAEIKPVSLHYNIQIHLPESRDPAVYDAIFRSLKEHLK
jgi:hypothetical protein